MDLRITPHRLSGAVNIPASKSMAHRAIICAALSEGHFEHITGVTFSKDIYATLSVMKALGAAFTINGDQHRISRHPELPSAEATADCCESGSTLRFLIPVAAALGTKTTFLGQGRLPERPITPYLRELPPKGVTFDAEGTMPFTIEGRLQPGEFQAGGRHFVAVHHGTAAGAAASERVIPTSC